MPVIRSQNASELGIAIPGSLIAHPLSARPLSTAIPRWTVFLFAQNPSPILQASDVASSPSCVLRIWRRLKCIQLDRSVAVDLEISAARRLNAPAHDPRHFLKKATDKPLDGRRLLVFEDSVNPLFHVGYASRGVTRRVALGDVATRIFCNLSRSGCAT